MRKLSNYLTIVAVALLITLLASDVSATGCRAVVVKKEIVVAEKVVAAAVVAPVVATFVPVVYPLYGAVYQPGVNYTAPAGQQAAQVDSDLSASVKALAEQVRVLSDKVGKVTGEAAPMMPRANDPPPAQPTKPTDPFNPQAQQVNPVTPIVMARCASCHDASKANTLGGKFVMTSAGKLKQLSGEELGKVIEQVGTGKMPRGQKMTDAERLQLIAGLVSQ